MQKTENCIFQEVAMASVKAAGIQLFGQVKKEATDASSKSKPAASKPAAKKAAPKPQEPKKKKGKGGKAATKQ
ncbi:hypothetical protein ERO13_A12G173100v2 [Gossypium hirsutum]|uniref:Uncharacterized protein n=6 Tax=Gossypium TaxID=3633 RepID=A0A5J5TF03_GOSBA|nr:hypothetical protein ES319_A12G181300v1 [Gossypium barbadense]KAG4170814.1 hypothetical protein ERO13_A12G173100v2 [Gossypium hirsutum]TYG90633.1 hypothetical protein ES288_A12G197600v1 [Gossypium darwinii]TYH96722.1 hypothetical protein ES332_A12G197200v1 [Gossypium tomentosum]TYJ05756.1 hypothetical protein E1A91_A12G185600v1 [Gossypium mustelinum]